MTADDRLIVALDVSSAREAEATVTRLSDSVSFYKVGMELIYSGDGFAFVKRLVDAKLKVFVDLKLHDIPKTVERATAQIARLGATFLTVHAYPQTMRAAKTGADGTGLKLLGVSVLTSADDADLAEAGYAQGAAAMVSLRARQAEDIGMDGLVASAAEVATLRGEGRKLLLVCPGIRPSGNSLDDQKRTATPGRAIRDGANYLVVGRPIVGAADPRGAAQAIAFEIRTARSS